MRIAIATCLAGGRCRLRRRRLRARARPPAGDRPQDHGLAAGPRPEGDARTLHAARARPAAGIAAQAPSPPAAGCGRLSRPFAPVPQDVVLHGAVRRPAAGARHAARSAATASGRSSRRSDGCQIARAKRISLPAARVQHRRRMREAEARRCLRSRCWRVAAGAGAERRAATAIDLKLTLWPTGINGDSIIWTARVRADRRRPPRSRGGVRGADGRRRSVRARCRRLPRCEEIPGSAPRGRGPGGRLPRPQGPVELRSARTRACRVAWDRIAPVFPTGF